MWAPWSPENVAFCSVAAYPIILDKLVFGEVPYVGEVKAQDEHNDNNDNDNADEDGGDNRRVAYRPRYVVFGGKGACWRGWTSWCLEELHLLER